MLKATQFLSQVSTVEDLIAAASVKQLAWRRELRGAAKQKLDEGISLLDKALPLAESVLSSADSVSQSEAKVAEASESVAEMAERIQGLQVLAESSFRSIAESVERAEADKKHLTEIQANFALSAKEAEKKLEDIEARQSVAFGALGSAEETIKVAHVKLTRAIEDINRQALAGAFDHRAQELAKERQFWLLPFVVSILGLVVVSYRVIEGAASGDAALALTNSLRGLPLAAPLVWLGWFSAKNVGLIGRLKADYEFKASTALAFEGYKKEIQSANDEALSRQLLETAVRNFGENPSRHYDSAKADSAMPTEALMTALRDDTVWTRFVDLLKALKPSGR